MNDSPAPPLRVLVVDDDRDSATMLSMLLQMSGCECRAAHDGPEAVEAAESYRPAAVLLDIGLPGLDGYGACRKIRAQPWGRDMVLAALTGWGEDEDRARSRDAGFDVHLVKPVDASALVKLLGDLAAAKRPH